jgi:hypothetical protein
MRLSALGCLLTSLLLQSVTAAVADDSEWGEWQAGGHSKFQWIGTRIPDNSLLYPLAGGELREQYLENRLKLSMRKGAWRFETHAQLIGVHSERLELSDSLALPVPGATLVNDGLRWFNLTHEFHRDGKNAVLFRLDRLSIGYTGEKTVLRFGRQAISWGNGLLFTPMDIMNPFDPAAVDKEYKSGDDMLYVQHLLDNGSDLQAVAVVRRDAITGKTESEVSSLAFKYHGFLSGLEYDVLAARHYDDDLLGFGLSSGLGGAVVSGDLTWSSTANGNFVAAVVGFSYSGVWSGRNWQGFFEYFYNGYGRSDISFSPESVAANPELFKRLARGELFNTGKHHLGASVMIELTPLVLVTPRLMVNVTDPSALAQMLVTYDWKQDLQVLAALNVPVGPNGSEYGGPGTGQTDTYFSTGSSLFLQIAWYF